MFQFSYSPDCQDAITLDIIQSNLRAISQEMFTAIKRTSVSPIIYEVLDMGCALTDKRGTLITSGAGLPSFIGMLNRNVQYILKTYQDNIFAGDIFITNSPYHGGITHLNDVIIARPLFVQGQNIAWAVNMGHWPDIGGMVAGSLSTDASEIFQEGLILPAVKICNTGHMDTNVLEIIMANSRLPKAVQGDLWAGVSACQIAQSRLTDMCKKYGIHMIKTAMKQIVTQGEQEAIQALKKYHKGTFSATVTGDGFTDFPLICTITDTEFCLDMTQAPPQLQSPYNVGDDGLHAAAQIVFKALVSPYTPANGGNYVPIKIKTTPATVFHPVSPAPQGMNFENRMAYFDAVLNIAVQIAPDTFGAGHFSSICGTFINGPHAVTGEHISLVEPQVGGWGANDNTDGTSAMFSASHGDTFNCPAEITEARYGVLVESLTLNPCQSGQGQFRGGKGVQIMYTMQTDNLKLTIAYSKGKHPTWGHKGGHDGGNNFVVIKRKNGHTQKVSYGSNIHLNTDDKIIIHTANGGGFGYPDNREKHRILDDIKNGYITRQTAQSIYNVKELYL